MAARSFDEEMKFLRRIDANKWMINKGFVPNMNVSPQRAPRAAVQASAQGRRWNDARTVRALHRCRVTST